MHYNNIMSEKFNFGGISVKSRKLVLNLGQVSDILLLDKSENKAPYQCVPVVIADEPYSKECLSGISKFLETAGLTRYKLVCAINCTADPRAIRKEGKIKFYKFHRSNFEDYISPNTPILTVGAALYSLLMEDDIYPSHVQQIIFGKSNFLFSKDLTRENCHRIYPIESFRDIFAMGFKNPVDSFKTKLAQIQINNLIRQCNTPIPRYPKLNKIFIESKKDFEERFYLPNKDRHDEVLAWDLETSGLNFTKDKIGCIQLSFDGITGYYIPWRIFEESYDCCVKLDEILGNNRQLLANGKFDCKFLWYPHSTKKTTIGYKIIEENNIKYKIMNDQDIKTQRGLIEGKDLLETDIIEDYSSLEKIQLY